MISLMTAFAAQTPVFEGPLEALLNLIEERKLSVSEVSLAKVADDFIAYAKRYEEFPIAESARFLLTASTLLLIKSKSLLPSLTLSEEEKTDIGELARRLALYQKVRGYGNALRARFGKNRMFLPEARERTPVFAPDAALTPVVLQTALQALLRQIPRPEVLAKVVVDKIISLNEVITRLTERVAAGIRLSFREFAEGSENRQSAGWRKEIIVSFLALLELVRRGALRVTQEKHFDDILMESDEISVPKYQ